MRRNPRYLTSRERVEGCKVPTHRLQAFVRLVKQSGVKFTVFVPFSTNLSGLWPTIKLWTRGAQTLERRGKKDIVEGNLKEWKFEASLRRFIHHREKVLALIPVSNQTNWTFAPHPEQSGLFQSPVDLRPHVLVWSFHLDSENCPSDDFGPIAKRPQKAIPMFTKNNEYQFICVQIFGPLWGMIGYRCWSLDDVFLNNVVPLERLGQSGCPSVSPC